MLYDRLIVDLKQAEVAIDMNAYQVANDKLFHAQQIIMELVAALDETAWSGAAGLGQLYNYFYAELIEANVNKDLKPIRSCREMIEQLADAWQKAYDAMLAEQAAGSSSASALPTAPITSLRP